MSQNNHPRDHDDMLRHVEAAKGRGPIHVKKPDWIVHENDAASASSGAPLPATPHDAKKSGRLGELLVHNAHTPSNGSFTPTPAPYKEDGSTVWERDGTAKKKKKLCYPDGQAAGEDHDDGEEEEEEIKENDPRWNVKRRSPAKRREGEFEKDFRSRKSYSGRHEDDDDKKEKEDEEEKKEVEKKEGEEEREKEEVKEEETKDEKTAEKKTDEKVEDSKSLDGEKKVKVPKHLVSGPLW